MYCRRGELWEDLTCDTAMNYGKIQNGHHTMVWNDYINNVFLCLSWFTYHLLYKFFLCKNSMFVFLFPGSILYAVHHRHNKLQNISEIQTGGWQICLHKSWWGWYPWQQNQIERKWSSVYQSTHNYLLEHLLIGYFHDPWMIYILV